MTTKTKKKHFPTGLEVAKDFMESVATKKWSVFLSFFVNAVPFVAQMPDGGIYWDVDDFLNSQRPYFSDGESLDQSLESIHYIDPSIFIAKIRVIGGNSESLAQLTFVKQMCGWRIQMIRNKKVL